MQRLIPNVLRRYTRKSSHSYHDFGYVFNLVWFALGADVGRYFLRQAQYLVAALAGTDFKSMLLLERDVHSR